MYVQERLKPHFTTWAADAQNDHCQHSQQANIRCFVASYAHMGGGGSQKVTSDDEGEGGSRYPQKMMTSFMNSILHIRFWKGCIFWDNLSALSEWELVPNKAS